MAQLIVANKISDLIMGDIFEYLPISKIPTTGQRIGIGTTTLLDSGEIVVGPAGGRTRIFHCSSTDADMSELKSQDFIHFPFICYTSDLSDTNFIKKSKIKEKIPLQELVQKVIETQNFYQPCEIWAVWLKVHWRHLAISVASELYEWQSHRFKGVDSGKIYSSLQKFGFGYSSDEMKELGLNRLECEPVWEVFGFFTYNPQMGILTTPNTSDKLHIHGFSNDRNKGGHILHAFSEPEEIVKLKLYPIDNIKVLESNLTIQEASCFNNLLSFKIYNAGDLDVMNVDIDIVFNNEYSDRIFRRIPSLLAGQMNTFNIDISEVAIFKEIETIHIVTDPNNLIMESDESDNTVFMEYSPCIKSIRDDRGIQIGIIASGLHKDAVQITHIFKTCYGDVYPFRQFYSIKWIERELLCDNSVTHVFKNNVGQVLGCASLIKSGDHDDNIAEFGRWASIGHLLNPKVKGVGKELFKSLITPEISGQYYLLYSDARTAHTGTQRIFEKYANFRPVGFEPLKYKIGKRESIINYISYCNHNEGLQEYIDRVTRPKPVIIEHAKPLVETVLDNLKLKREVIYCPLIELKINNRDVKIEVKKVTDQAEYHRFINITKGRIQDPVIFGNIHLNNGFFHFDECENTLLGVYINGRPKAYIIYAYDSIDSIVKFLEFGYDEDVLAKFGNLIISLAISEIAAQVSNVVLWESDLSAYNPKIQTIFSKNGFVPMAYFPAMVFHNTERLDVIRFGRLDIPYTRKGPGVSELHALGMESKTDPGTPTPSRPNVKKIIEYVEEQLKQAVPN